MNSLRIGNRHYQVPASFNELSAVQLVSLARLLHTPQMRDQVRLQALLILLRVRRRLRLQWHFQFSLSDATVFDLLVLTDWIFRDNLTKNVLPLLRIGFRRLYGPADELSNLAFIEFIKAENRYESYIRTGEERFLDQLISILYRPKTARHNPKDPEYSGDIRQKYNDHFVDNRQRHISRLPMATRLAVFMFYDGCRSLIIQNHPNIFSKPGGEADAKKRGWGHVLSELAGNVNHYEQTAYQPLGTVLMHLELTIQQTKELEEKLATLKNGH